MLINDEWTNVLSDKFLQRIYGVMDLFQTALCAFPLEEIAKSCIANSRNSLCYFDARRKEMTNAQYKVCFDLIHSLQNVSLPGLLYSLGIVSWSMEIIGVYFGVAHKYLSLA